MTKSPLLLTNAREKRNVEGEERKKTTFQSLID